MQLLKDYFTLQKQVHEYFGYVEDWVAIPLDDATDYFWKLHMDEHGGGTVVFGEEYDTVEQETGTHYENVIYTQRFLPKWVYRGEDYTMVCADTRTDGNKFLQVFDNTKELKDEC